MVRTDNNTRSGTDMFDGSLHELPRRAPILPSAGRGHAAAACAMACAVACPVAAGGRASGCGRGER